METDPLGFQSRRKNYVSAVEELSFNQIHMFHMFKFFFCKSNIKVKADFRIHDIMVFQ